MTTGLGTPHPSCGPFCVSSPGSLPFLCHSLPVLTRGILEPRKRGLILTVGPSYLCYFNAEDSEPERCEANMKAGKDPGKTSKRHVMRIETISIYNHVSSY